MRTAHNLKFDNRFATLAAAATMIASHAGSSTREESEHFWAPGLEIRFSRGHWWAVLQAGFAEVDAGHYRVVSINGVSERAMPDVVKALISAKVAFDQTHEVVLSDLLVRVRFGSHELDVRPRLLPVARHKVGAGAPEFQAPTVPSAPPSGEHWCYTWDQGWLLRPNQSSGRPADRDASAVASPGDRHSIAWTGSAASPPRSDGTQAFLKTRMLGDLEDCGLVVRLPVAAHGRCIFLIDSGSPRSLTRKPFRTASHGSGHSVTVGTKKFRIAEVVPIVSPDLFSGLDRRIHGILGRDFLEQAIISVTPGTNTLLIWHRPPARLQARQKGQRRQPLAGSTIRTKQLTSVAARSWCANELVRDINGNLAIPRTVIGGFACRGIIDTGSTITSVPITAGQGPHCCVIANCAQRTPYGLRQTESYIADSESFPGFKCDDPIFIRNQEVTPACVILGGDVLKQGDWILDLANRQFWFKQLPVTNPTGTMQIGRLVLSERNGKLFVAVPTGFAVTPGTYEVVSYNGKIPESSDFQEGVGPMSTLCGRAKIIRTLGLDGHLDIRFRVGVDVRSIRFDVDIPYVSRPRSVPAR